MRKPDLLKPTLLAGILFGLVASIPVLNCCCCLWWSATGCVAVVLYNRAAVATGYRVRLADGALLGLIAGLFGGFTTTIFDLIFEAICGDRIRELALGWMNSMPQDPQAAQMLGGLRQMLEKGGSASVIGMIVSLFVHLFFFSLFGTVGGVITALVVGRGGATPAAPGSQWHPPAGPPSPPPGMAAEQPMAFGPGAPPSPPPPLTTKEPGSGS